MGFIIMWTWCDLCKIIWWGSCNACLATMSCAQDHFFSWDLDIDLDNSTPILTNLLEKFNIHVLTCICSLISVESEKSQTRMITELRKKIPVLGPINWHVVMFPNNRLMPIENTKSNMNDNRTV